MEEYAHYTIPANQLQACFAAVKFHSLHEVNTFNDLLAKCTLHQIKAAARSYILSGQSHANAAALISFLVNTMYVSTVSKAT